MKKEILFTLSLAAWASMQSQAQIVPNKDGKLDFRAERLVRDFERARLVSRTPVADVPVTVIVTCTDADGLIGEIEALGGTANKLGNGMMTAEIPTSRLKELAARPDIKTVSTPRQFYPTLTSARAMTDADKVQAGEGLETPYTGKGVVVGVIDQGFQYGHIAFKDAAQKTRVHSVWNLSVKNSRPTKGIPSTAYDNIQGAGGHATHVTCIAAGSRVAGNGYYGMAPEATIVMIPSTLGGDQIMQGAAYIKEVAEELGSPWVTNMSFGSQIGPHDGTTDQDIYMSGLCGRGGIMVGAMGNEGAMKIHTSYKFKDTEELKHLILTAPGEDNDYNYLDIWGTATDNLQHLSVTPATYNPTTKAITPLTSAELEEIAYIAGGEINKNNRKEHYSFYIDYKAMQALPGKSNAQFCVEVKALDELGEFHAWINPRFGEFERKITTALSGNSNYLVGEGAASIPAAIAVASYTGAGNWVALPDGLTYHVPGATTEAMSSFSSPGPWLGNEQKPTVSAPGGNIAAAVNKYEGFDKAGVDLVSAVHFRTGEAVAYTSNISISATDFYGIKSGTSMATPAVTGIVALWLQANPYLTPEQVKDIIRTTVKHDNYAPAGPWRAKSGYGKIDAYTGLKEALRLLEADGIEETTIGADQPVTLKKSAGAWHILFNRAEPAAEVTVISLGGNVVSREHLGNVVAGNETVVDLSNLPAGAYLIRIKTAGADITRKVIR